MDTTENGRSAVTTIMLVVGFIFLISVPALITYYVMKDKVSIADTQSPLKDLVRKAEYTITGAISTVDPAKEKANHESLQTFINDIDSTIAEYNQLSGITGGKP